MSWTKILNKSFSKKVTYIPYSELQQLEEQHNKYKFVLSCAETFTKRD